MKILIVDDDSNSRKELQEILDSFGECEANSSGITAITAVEKALEEGDPFQLITLDLVLPDMDGTEVLFEIREMEEEWEKKGGGDKAVILIITTVSDRDAIATSFSAGCDDFIIKPFGSQTIIERLRKSKLRDQVHGPKTTDRETLNPIRIVIDRFNSGKLELPSLPKISIQLNEMAKKGLDFAEIAALLKQDMSITSKIISISNSTYYGAITKNKTVDQAIGRLGLIATKQYVDAMCNRNFFATANKKYSKVMEELWTHSLYCAVASEVVAKFLKLDLKGDAFTMGLMHDIGKVVLLQGAADLESRGKFGGEVDHDELFGSINAYHNKFGAKALEKWNFVDEYAQIALHHDDLGGMDAASKDLLVVHFANLFVKTIANDGLDQTGLKIEDAESARLLKIAPDMIGRIGEQVDKQIAVYD